MKTYFSIIEELKKEIPDDSVSADMSAKELAAYKQGAEDYLEILKVRFGFKEKWKEEENEKLS